MSAIINKAHPNKQLPQISKPPLHMPLKLCIFGPRATGKSTQLARLAERYGLLIINPTDIITEALSLAKPPVEEDPKKAKKDNKKAEEPTAEKIALKEMGTKFM
jgi:cytidylate kinase